MITGRSSLEIDVKARDSASREFRNVAQSAKDMGDAMENRATLRAYRLANALNVVGGVANRIATAGFTAVTAQVGLLTVAMGKLSAEFINVNQQFAQLDITLGSSLKSMRAAKSITDELARITARSPIPFTSLASGIQSAAVMPQTRGLLLNQSQSGNLSNPEGFMRRFTRLVEQMVTFRPDQGAEGSIFAIRELLGGQSRSLVRRFDIPLKLLTSTEAAGGRSFQELKDSPDLLLKSLMEAFNRIISPEAVEAIARQPRVLFENMVEQSFTIPLFQVGRQGSYDRVLNSFQQYFDRLSVFMEAEFESNFAPRFSEQVSSIFTIAQSAGEGAVRQLFDEFSIGDINAPLIERALNGVESFLSFIEVNTPVYIALGQELLPKVAQAFVFLAESAQTILDTFLSLSNTLGPTLTVLIAISLPALISGIGNLLIVMPDLVNGLKRVTGGMTRFSRSLTEVAISGQKATQFAGTTALTRRGVESQIGARSFDDFASSKGLRAFGGGFIDSDGKRISAAQANQRFNASQSRLTDRAAITARTNRAALGGRALAVGGTVANAAKSIALLSAILFAIERLYSISAEFYNREKAIVGTASRLETDIALQNINSPERQALNRLSNGAFSSQQAELISQVTRLSGAPQMTEATGVDALTRAATFSIEQASPELFRNIVTSMQDSILSPEVTRLLLDRYNELVQSNSIIAARGSEGIQGSLNRVNLDRRFRATTQDFETDMLGIVSQAGLQNFQFDEETASRVVSSLYAQQLRATEEIVSERFNQFGGVASGDLASTLIASIIREQTELSNTQGIRAAVEQAGPLADILPALELGQNIRMNSFFNSQTESMDRFIESQSEFLNKFDEFVQFSDQRNQILQGSPATATSPGIPGLIGLPDKIQEAGNLISFQLFEFSEFANQMSRTEGDIFDELSKALVEIRATMVDERIPDLKLLAESGLDFVNRVSVAQESIALGIQAMGTLGVNPEISLANQRGLEGMLSVLAQDTNQNVPRQFVGAQTGSLLTPLREEALVNQRLNQFSQFPEIARNALGPSISDPSNEQIRKAIFAIEAFVSDQRNAQVSALAQRDLEAVLAAQPFQFNSAAFSRGISQPSTFQNARGQLFATESDRLTQQSRFLDQGQATIDSANVNNDTKNALQEMLAIRQQELELLQAQFDLQRSIAGFQEGFISSIRDNLEQAQNLAQLGNDIAQSLQDNLGNAFGDFVTGAKSAGEAMKDFAADVLNEVARMFASRAVAMLFGTALSAFGGGIGSTAAPIGSGIGGNGFSVGTFSEGGPITQGSGVRDDVPILAKRGEFIIRPEIVSKFGQGFFDLINRGGMPQGFTTGGMVGFDSPPSRGGNSGAPNVKVDIKVEAGNNVSASSEGMSPQQVEVVKKSVQDMVRKLMVEERRYKGALS